MIEHCQMVLLYACIGILGGLALVSIVAFAAIPIRRFMARVRSAGRLNSVLALFAVVTLVVYGGTKPVLWAFVESYWVVEQYFLIRTELMVGLILKMNAMASKKYPPAIPIQ